VLRGDAAAVQLEGDRPERLALDDPPDHFADDDGFVLPDRHTSLLVAEGTLPAGPFTGLRRLGRDAGRLCVPGACRIARVVAPVRRPEECHGGPIAMGR